VLNCICTHCSFRGSRSLHRPPGWHWQQPRPVLLRTSPAANLSMLLPSIVPMKCLYGVAVASWRHAWPSSLNIREPSTAVWNHSSATQVDLPRTDPEVDNRYGYPVIFFQAHLGGRKSSIAATLSIFPVRTCHQALPFGTILLEPQNNCQEPAQR
jgi:hypothetical protein